LIFGRQDYVAIIITYYLISCLSTRQLRHKEIKVHIYLYPANIAVKISLRRFIAFARPTLNNYQLLLSSERLIVTVN